MADGDLELVVVGKLNDGVMTVASNEYQLGEKKNMNLPNCQVDIPVISKKDQKDILEWGVKNQVDMIAVSFAQTGNDMKVVKEIIYDKLDAQIIAKIENHAGLRNYDDILDHCDGIMVARGDLGMEIEPQKVFVAQK